MAERPISSYGDSGMGFVNLGEVVAENADFDFSAPASSVELIQVNGAVIH